MILPYWSEPLLPDYRAGKHGQWRAFRSPPLKKLPGYFTAQTNQPAAWVFKRGKTVWMSLTRMEIESQMMHFDAAHGHVVIAGLGMGLALYNIMRKPEVTKVTLLERDAEVVELMNRVSGWRRWRGRDKLNLVMGDALEYVADEPVDFLYADIWAHLGDNDALAITQTIQRNVRAKNVGFWGQEFDLIEWCQQKKMPHSMINRSAYRQFAHDVDLPLIEQHSFVYPRLAFLAVIIQTALHHGDKEQQFVMLHAANMVILEDDPIDDAIRIPA